MAWNYTYDEMLKRAYNVLPKNVFEKKRFEVPRVQGLIQGNKTIVSNFNQISDYLSRPPEHLLKFLLRELATSGSVEGSHIVFTGKFKSSDLNEKIDKYVNEFVICRECGKPDTKLLKEERLTFMKCMACGSKRNLRSIK